MKPEVFLDTSYAIALCSPADQLHARAVLLAQTINAERTRLFTTHGVLLEFGNALAKRRFRATAIDVLDSMHSDPSLRITPITQELYEQTFEYFRRHVDKEWGLVDCASFVVMKKLGLTEALTADEHFEQAGFRALLRHP